MSTRDELRALFHRRAPEVFAELARRHGLVPREAQAEVVALASPRCRLELSFGGGHLPDLGVTLAPAAEPARAFGLGPVLEQLDDPAVAFASRPLLSAEDVEAELRRAARLLARHCAHVLDGDFSAWPAVQAQVSRRVEEWKRRPRGPTARRATWLVRARAAQAYGQGDHVAAAELYGSIEGELSAPERRRLDYARRAARRP